MIVKKKS